MNDLIVAGVGAAIGGIVAYFLAIQRAQLDLLVKVDEATRKDRVESYKKLWAMTALLPRYPPESNVPYAKLGELCESFRDWYFEGHGIYLSAEARDVYFEVQELLIEYANKAGDMNPFDNEGNYDKKSDYETVRNELSTLRTQLTEDIGSRRSPSLKQIAEDSLYVR